MLGGQVARTARLVACDDDAGTPTDQSVQAYPGEVYKRKEDAVIAAFEQDLAARRP